MSDRLTSGIRFLLAPLLHMHHYSNTWRGPALGLVCLSLNLLGCGSGGPPQPPSAEVSGTVTLDGTPLAEGNILFEEADKGLMTVLPIRNGNFSGKVPIGEKKVLISAIKDGPPNEMYPGEPTKVNVIPAKYNQDSELKASVSQGGAKGLEFKVTSM